MLLSNKWQSSERQRMTAELWKIFLYCNINIAFTLPNLFWKWPKCCSLKIRKFQKYGAIQWLMGNVSAQIQTFYKGHEMFLKITQLYTDLLPVPYSRWLFEPLAQTGQLQRNTENIHGISCKMLSCNISQVTSKWLKPYTRFPPFFINLTITAIMQFIPWKSENMANRFPADSLASKVSSDISG